MADASYSGPSWTSSTRDVVTAGERTVRSTAPVAVGTVSSTRTGHGAARSSQAGAV